MALISMNGGGDITQVLADEDWIVEQHLPGRLWTIGQGNNAANTPVQIGSGVNWSRLYPIGPQSGTTHFAMTKDGQVYGWGTYNDTGQLGIGSTANQTSPGTALSGSYKNWRLVTGGSSSAGIRSDGTLWTWGQGYYGLLLDGSTANRTTPSKVGTDTDWHLIQYPTNGSMVLLKTNGDLYLQNTIYSGYSGANISALSLNREAGPWGKARQIASDDGSLVILGEDGKMYLFDGANFNWGRSGQSSPIDLGAIISSAGDRSWSQVAVMGYKFGTNVANWTQSIIAIAGDGTLWSYGYNDYGQLGLGDTTYRTSFVQVGTSNDWKQVISSGINYRACMAVKHDGTLWAWGRNQGLFGNGSTADSYSPVRVGSYNYWKEIAVSQGKFVGISYY